MPGQVSSPQRRSHVIKRLEKAVPGIRATFGVKRIGIFGSFARGDETRNSDVDVLVELADGYATLRNFIGLADYLEDLFKRKVDLITVEGIDKYIRPRVESEVIWIEG